MSSPGTVVEPPLPARPEEPPRRPTGTHGPGCDRRRCRSRGRLGSRGGLRRLDHRRCRRTRAAGGPRRPRRSARPWRSRAADRRGAETITGFSEVDRKDSELLHQSHTRRLVSPPWLMQCRLTQLGPPPPLPGGTAPSSTIRKAATTSRTPPRLCIRGWLALPAAVLRWVGFDGGSWVLVTGVDHGQPAGSPRRRCEGADQAGSALDLLVDSLEQVGGPQHLPSTDGPCLAALLEAS